MNIDPPPAMDVLEQVVELFHLHGHMVHDGLREGPVTALAHALQCAQFAEWAEAPASLVVAALLHDVGHIIAPARGSEVVDDDHDLLAVGLLATAFGPEVTEPIRLHLQAGRYLLSVDPRYAATLPTASARTLAAHGGLMATDELRRFKALPFASEATALRRWDDLAVRPRRPTPTLAYYLSMADTVRSVHQRDQRSPIGALGMA